MVPQNINYPGMRCPKEVVGKYYLRESTEIVTDRRATIYFDKHGNQRFRNTKTGRFISEKDLDRILENPHST